MASKVEDSVRYKEGLLSGAQRRGQIGIIVKVTEMPTSDGPRVDIQFPDGVDVGISVHQIERA